MYNIILSINKLSCRLKKMDIYRKAYTLRFPDEIKIRNDDEKRLLTTADGVDNLENKINSRQYCDPPKTKDENRESKGKYIWVIMQMNTPMILEYAAAGDTLESKRVTHTNLTGGKAAYCGGEVWFNNGGNDIYVSGKSGRYPARSLEELNEVCKALGRIGYNVINLGWDEDINQASGYLRR